MDIRNECLSTIWLLGDFVLEALTHFNGMRVMIYENYRLFVNSDNVKLYQLSVIIIT